MVDTFIQIVLSNAVLALALAIVALTVGAVLKRPQLAHLLWLLVLVKLLTPPLVTIPVITLPEQPVSTVVSMENYAQTTLLLAYSPAEKLFTAMGDAKNEIALFWLLGSVLVLGWSLVRVHRFNRLLGQESEVAPRELQTTVAGIADRLGLKTVPTIYITAAKLSPMVWWVGGNVRVIVPAALRDQMDSRQFQWILAHELAHVRRRDYLVRCIEWLACVCFWWNPVMWWARYNLRINEELCCDALVVSSLKPKPHIYGNSLAKAVEYLAAPAYRSPAIASEINSGGFLKRRFKMIISAKLYRPNSRWLQAGVLVSALAVLVLGLACETGQAVTNPEAQSEEGTLSISEEQIPDSVRAASYMIYLDQTGRPVQRAVWGEELTEEEAKLSLAEAKLLSPDSVSSALSMIYLDQTGRLVQRAVWAEELTEEEAKLTLAEAERLRLLLQDRDADAMTLRLLYQAQEAAQNRINLDSVALRQRIEAAVEADTMTNEEAEARIAKAFMTGAVQTSEEADSLRESIQERMRDELIRKEADLLRLRQLYEAQERQTVIDRDVYRLRIEDAEEANTMTREEADSLLRRFEERVRAAEQDQ